MPDILQRSESGVISSTPTKGKDTDEYGDPHLEDGELLAKPEEEAAKIAYDMWESQDEILERKMAQWEVNEYRRRGITHAKLSKDQDRWIAWIPSWASTDPDRSNQILKAATLCRRMSSVMFADPPAPEAVPATGEDADAQAAEFTTRALVDIQSETALNEVGKARKAFDRASSYGSGFIRYWVDPRGGGRVPIEIQAGVEKDENGTVIRSAQHIDEAEIDPSTGFAWPAYEERFVRKDGTLTEDRSEAATRFSPVIRSEVLTGRNVRMIPHTAEDIWDADGAQCGAYVAWGELKSMFPELEELEKDEEKMNKIFAFSPKHARWIRPDSVKKTGEKFSSVDEKNRDAQLVFTLTTYFKAGNKYERGLYMVSLADCYVAYRDVWVLEVDGIEEPMDIPLTQYCQFDEGVDDPYKVSLMEIIGPGDALRSAQVDALLDHLDRLSGRKTFIPTTSNITPRDLQSGRKYLDMLPGTAPVYEEIPPFPSEGLHLYDIASQEMEQASALNQTAQGLEAPSVESGRHAYAIISQVHAGLSELKQNTERAYVRSCRIQLQMIRAFFDAPRQMRWVGEDGEYKRESWVGSDLGSTRDVRLKPGTLTMLSPGQKAQLAEHYGELGVLPPEDLREALAENLGGTIALTDDPFRMRIRRQIAAWAKGPPDNWTPPAPPIDPMTGQPMVDPMTGQPLEPPPDPAIAMWEPVPSDELPNIAQIRLIELSRLMASTRYTKHEAAWRAPVDEEFMRMRDIVMPPQQPQQPAAPPALPPGPEGGPPADIPEGMAPEIMGVGMDEVPPEVAGALPPEEAAGLGIDVGSPGQMPPGMV